MDGCVLRCRTKGKRSGRKKSHFDGVIHAEAMPVDSLLVLTRTVIFNLSEGGEAQGGAENNKITWVRNRVVGYVLPARAYGTGLYEIA